LQLFGEHDDQQNMFVGCHSAANYTLLSGGRRRRTKRMRNNETVVNGQVKVFGRPGGRTDRPCHVRVYTRAIRSFIALPSLCPL
jgi:hypothetical protein